MPAPTNINLKLPLKFFRYTDPKNSITPKIRRTMTGNLSTSSAFALSSSMPPPPSNLIACGTKVFVHHTLIFFSRKLNAEVPSARRSDDQVLCGERAKSAELSLFQVDLNSSVVFRSGAPDRLDTVLINHLPDRKRARTMGHGIPVCFRILRIVFAKLQLLRLS